MWIDRQRLAMHWGILLHFCQLYHPGYIKKKVQSRTWVPSVEVGVKMYHSDWLLVSLLQCPERWQGNAVVSTKREQLWLFEISYSTRSALLGRRPIR